MNVETEIPYVFIYVSKCLWLTIVGECLLLSVGVMSVGSSTWVVVTVIVVLCIIKCCALFTHHKLSTLFGKWRHIKKNAALFWQFLHHITSIYYMYQHCFSYLRSIYVHNSVTYHLGNDQENSWQVVFENKNIHHNICANSYGKIIWLKM